jgi:hypothetical protein
MAPHSEFLRRLHWQEIEEARNMLGSPHVRGFLFEHNRCCISEVVSCILLERRAALQRDRVEIRMNRKF